MRISPFALLLLASACCLTTAQTALAKPSQTAPDDMRALEAAAIASVEAYFGAPFPEEPNIVIAENRAAFNAAFPPEWGMTETECWMVGVGVADFLVVLSPAAWPAEACDHDGSDREEVRRIVTHELTHTYHGQRNPTRDFTGAESLSWFIEGLATSVADPASESRRKRVVEALQKGSGPSSLAEVWTGDARYQVAGLLVDYIDEKWGRDKIIKLLPAITQDDALNILGVSEQELLSGYRAWALSGAGGH